MVGWLVMMNDDDVIAGGRPAPAPPRRDPRTTLSVGRARAKSMVAGLGEYTVHPALLP